ncbi:MAG TPA: hypothetical protein VHP32_02210 [Ignavibacteria bacterium]|nr:hypothetical protein [Ignavibacteria bacterium]
MRYLKIKFIISFSVLVLAVLSCESAPDIKPKIYFDGLKFRIENTDAFSYKNVDLTVNDKYEAHIDSIPSGKSYEIGMSIFADEEGNRLTTDKKVLKMCMDCYILDNKKRTYCGDWK